MFCYTDFEYGSINFHKQRKQPAKYQYLGIAHLIWENKLTLSKSEEWILCDYVKIEIAICFNLLLRLSNFIYVILHDSFVILAIHFQIVCLKDF